MPARFKTTARAFFIYLIQKSHPVAMSGIHAVPDADAMKVASGCVMIAA